MLRLIQGFAVAGEISGASSMVLEHVPFGRRGFYASFALQGVQAGQILAAAVFLPIAAYMPSEAFTSSGWRVPFLLSFFVIVAGYIIRRGVEETPAFAQEDEEGKIPTAPIIQAFKTSWRDMLRVVSMALLPALFATVAPPGSTNIPLTIGAITFSITAIAAVAAASARETYRLPVRDLGNPRAVPMAKPDYERLRAAAIDGTAPA